MRNIEEWFENRTKALDTVLKNKFPNFNFKLKCVTGIPKNHIEIEIILPIEALESTLK